MIIYLAAPELRRVQWWVSCCTTAFGFTEPLFITRYWHPPSVLGLARTLHADLESFIFCFSIGGVAAVLYNFITATPVLIPPKGKADHRRELWQAIAFLFPVVGYVPLYLATNRPLWSGVVVMLLGTIVRLFRFPELRAKTLLGGGLFGVFYLLAMTMFHLLSPGYIARVWAHDILGGFIAGFPMGGIFFGLTFGWLWSGIYEDFQWSFSRVTES